MADVHGVLSLTLKDYLGVQGSHALLVKIADTTTLAQLATDVAAYSVLLNPLTGCMGVIANVSLQFPTTGLKTSATSGIRLGDGALMSFGITGQPYKYSIVIPGIDTSCITNGGLSETEVDTAAWISWIQANATHFAVESKARIGLTGFLGSRLNDRDSRKGLTKKTFRPHQ